MAKADSLALDTANAALDAMEKLLRDHPGGQEDSAALARIESSVADAIFLWPGDLKQLNEKTESLRANARRLYSQAGWMQQYGSVEKARTVVLSELAALRRIVSQPSS
jgi:hypothetical protein